MRHPSILLRLLLAFLLAALLPLIGLQQSLSQLFTDALREKIIGNLVTIANHKVDLIDQFVLRQLEHTRQVAQSPGTVQALGNVNKAYTTSGLSSPAYRQLRQSYLQSISMQLGIEGFYDVFLITPEGEIILTEKQEADLGTNLFTGTYRNSQLAQVTRQALQVLDAGFSDFEWYPPSNDYAAFVAAPIMDGTHVIGAVAFQVSNDAVQQAIADYRGLGQTGEIVLAQKKSDHAVIVAPLRNDPGIAFKRELEVSQYRAVPLVHALRGERGAGESIDYRGIPVLASWRYLPKTRWGMVVKIDQSEAYAPVQQLRTYSYLLLAAALLVATFMATWLGRAIVRPVKALTRAAVDIAEGHLEQRVQTFDDDEVGQLAVAFNRMTDSLVNTQHDLEEAQQGLEQKVEQRTAALTIEIEERRRAQAALQVAELAFQTAAEAIMVTDANGVILSINPALTEITGFSAAELIGRTPSMLKSGHHDAEFYADLWHSVLTEGYWRGEIWDRRKNGDVYPKMLSIKVVKDETGAPYRFVAVFSDISTYKKAEETIRHQANYDALTGLPNRRLFLDRLGQELKKASRESSTLALFFVDLDNFKEINDSLGHEYGDQLLQEVSRRIQGSIRETDTVSRLGGDEFTVILPDIGTDREADRIAQKIISELGLPFKLNDKLSHIGASIGITMFPVDGTDESILLKNADQAMYEAKHLGKNRFCYFTEAMQQASVLRIELSAGLREAVRRRQFQLHYQPIVSLTDGSILKAEALIRWQHPTKGMVNPAVFIPRAEEIGLIGEIGQFVFETAVSAAASWQTAGVGINLSPRQFNGPNGFDHWAKLCNEAGIAPSNITLEITEGMLLDGRPEVMQQLQKLRDDGFKIAIDDFGTGYSSLSYLKKFTTEYLKIDQSFIRDLATDSSDLALVEAIVVMAHKLGIEVIAEGVETLQQQAILTEMGCDYAQGYFYARPMPATDFSHYLANHATTRLET